MSEKCIALFHLLLDQGMAFADFYSIHLAAKEKYHEREIDDMASPKVADVVLNQEFGHFPPWRWAILFTLTQEALGDGGLLPGRQFFKSSYGNKDPSCYTWLQNEFVRGAIFVWVSSWLSFVGSNA